MKSGLTQCAECGTLTPNDFCSRECEDLFTYGSHQAGRSLLAMGEMGRIGVKGGRPRRWEPPSVAVPGEPVDFENLPF